MLRHLHIDGIEAFQELLAAERPTADAESTENLRYDKVILATDAGAAARNCADIRAWYGMNETGRATDAVCDYIIDKLER